MSFFSLDEKVIRELGPPHVGGPTCWIELATLLVLAYGAPCQLPLLEGTESCIPVPGPLKYARNGLDIDLP